MARRSSRRRSSADASKMLVGIGLGLFALAGFAFLGWASFSIKKTDPQDPTTHCSVMGPSSTTVVLIDSTDGLSNTTKLDLRQRLIELGEEIPKGGLLEIRLLEPSIPGGQVVFSRCNIGAGSELSELTANPTLQKKKWQEIFRKPLDEALEKSLQGNIGRYSPIIQAIQRISIERFSGASKNASNNKLIIVSDMLENTSDYSQYRGDASFERYRQSNAYQPFRTDLHDAAVSIWYLQKKLPRGIKTEDHLRFWQQWIKDNKGRLSNIDAIQGVKQ